MSITGDSAPIESLVSLGIQPHPSIVEDKFSKDIRKIIRPTEKCVKSIKCMHVQQSGTGSMKSLALINSGKEDALFLFCPFTSEKQLNRANTGADLLVLEDFIAITPAVDIQQKTTGRKRASMLEESEVDITITVGNNQSLSLLLPYSVTLLEILQKVKQAIHNSRNQELVFNWLEYYRELIAVTNPEDVRNSLLLSNSIEDSCSVPLIELENSNSPPKQSYTHQELNLTLDPFSPMRKHSQDSLCLTSADIQLFEDQDTFLNISRNVNREDPRKTLSKSESNLVKFKEKDHKKQKKKSDDQARFTSSFTTFYTDMDIISCNGDDTVAANKRNSRSDNDLRMDNISLSSSSSASNHSPSSQRKQKVKSKFYVTPGESERDSSIDVMYKNSSYDSQDHSVTTDDVAGLETSNPQMENFAQSLDKRADNDPHFRSKSKKKFQAIGTAFRSIQDNWGTSHAHQESQRTFHRGPLQLADNERRRMSASLREKGVTQLVRSESLPSHDQSMSWEGIHTTNTNLWLEWINANILNTDLLCRYKLELNLLPHQVVYSKMRARHAEFTYQESHFILVTTFNVNGKPSPPSLRKWLTDTVGASRIPDLYVIGFQELDLSPEALMTSGNKMEDEWKEAIEVCLRGVGNYRCVKAIRMVGVYLLVYCRGRLYSHISEIDSHSVPTGVLGIIGNKGGVSIRFRFHHTEICFVNSHLAAHVSEVERRNQDFNDILTKTRFEVPMKTKSIIAHDIVVWLGDLNYRLITTPEVTIDNLKELIAGEQYEKLYEYDQLRIEIEKDRVFSEFFEAPLSFKPTYKYNPGTDDWDSSEKHRPPAWCDRILWRGSHIGLLDYKSHPQIKISDHKPVSAYFEVGMKVIDNKKERRVFEDICWQLDKEENEYLPQVEISELTPKFQEIHFGKPETRGITVKNVGQSAVSLSFIPKIDEIDICKPWLSVSPESSVINKAESIELQFTIEILEEIAWSLNKNKNLEDILILHLEGGKDFFITIQATYIASCFGSSLEYLSHLRVPFFQARVPTGKLIDIGDVTTVPDPVSRYTQSLMLDDNVELPQELVAMVEYLKEHAGKTENLFQERGLKWEMDNIRECLDIGDPLTGSVHSIAACLLTFLAALENPVIPFHLQMKCLDASSNYIISKQVVLKELPESHKTTFRYLIRFLHHLLRDNAQCTPSISHIFGSILLRSEYKMVAKSKMEQNPNRDELFIAKKKTTFIYQFLSNPVI